MYQVKLMRKQIEMSGVRLGDSCSIYPLEGNKKAITLNRHCIDFVSTHYRPSDLSLCYIELPRSQPTPFHYRLQLDKNDDKGRFVLKTIKGSPFWLNGSAAREAFVERPDRLFIDDNKMNFNPFNLEEMVNLHFEHPILLEQNLIQSDLKILIQGETGTGKTHLAKKIHEKSGRNGRFMSINLSSYNPSLIESELFGHKKGAFTGAISDKVGALVQSEGGTLFLDEIDSLPLDVQTKLLTFLDSNKFRRVGDTREFSLNTRLIFASGRPLEMLVQQGLFRKDFYFRLKSGQTIELQSLRSDVKRIKKACQFFALKNNLSFSQRLLDFYETLAWPGNLRQLLGHLEKKKILSRSRKLDFDHLDEELLLQSSDLMSLALPTELVSLQNLKEEYVKKALAQCHGNIALAARKIGITEKTFRGLLLKSS
jgi:transcriptional regulator of acetoin/glycerol metabolism